MCDRSAGDRAAPTCNRRPVCGLQPTARQHPHASAKTAARTHSATLRRRGCASPTRTHWQTRKIVCKKYRRKRCCTTLPRTRSGTQHNWRDTRRRTFMAPFRIADASRATLRRKRPVRKALSRAPKFHRSGSKRCNAQSALDRICAQQAVSAAAALACHGPAACPTGPFARQARAALSASVAAPQQRGALRAARGTPLRTGVLSQRLRPLGQTVSIAVSAEGAAAL